MKRRLVLLIIFFVLLTGNSKAQHISEAPLKSYFKGMGYVLPGDEGFIYIGILSYERDISSRSSLELTAIYLSVGGEYYDDHIEVLYPGYKYYFPSKNTFFKKCWIGGYLAYSHLSTSYYDGKPINGKYSNGIGAGLSFGRKTFFKKGGKVFFDLGIGLSVNTALHTDKTNCTLTYEFPYYIPRIIFLLGFSN